MVKKKLGYCIVEKSDDGIQVEESCFAAIESAVDKAAKMEGLESYESYIILSDDAYLHELNREYRSVDSATDVLSFPENDLSIPLAQAIGEGFVPETDVTGERISLGDIYISVEQAARQAEEYGNSLEEELCFLAVHGMLHLMGYDHMEEQDEQVMREKQREALGRK